MLKALLLIQWQILNDYTGNILKLKTRVSDASTYYELLMFA